MKIDPHQITILDPSELTLHPVARELPELADEDADFIALVDDVRDRGVIHPLAITSKKQILDGRHRWRAAKRLKLPAVPVIVHDDADAVSIILESLLLRRHYSKSALAFTAYPMLKAAYELALENREAHSVRDPFTTASQAEKFGISKRFYEYAAKVHDIFAKDHAYRDLLLPEILSGEVGLGAVIAGYAGREATHGKPKPKEDKLKLFRRAWTDFKNRQAAWDNFNADQRTEALAAIDETLQGMPEGLLMTLERRLKTEIKQRQEAR